ncbi:kinase-like protein [Auricularia subglabra TFB-10046 SS5]|nr:kinase-like protein [Auricularia subglabra TFB-10046 SS5]
MATCLTISSATIHMIAGLCYLLVVEYLYVNEGIVHGRLKCQNVLITDDGTAVLSDVGLSTVLTTDADEASFSLPRQAFQVAFAAPERVRRAVAPTMPTDVYAFAMLVLQAYTRLPPWAGLGNTAIVSNVRRGEIPPRPALPAPSDAWWGVCVQCWAIAQTLVQRSRTCVEGSAKFMLSLPRVLR